MGRGLSQTASFKHRDAGSLDTLVSEFGAEHALAILVIRQAVSDWRAAQKRKPNKRLHADVARFFDSAWFQFITSELNLEPEHIVSTLRER